jgi:hypothetical protein
MAEAGQFESLTDIESRMCSGVLLKTPWMPSHAPFPPLSSAWLRIQPGVAPTPTPVANPRVRAMENITSDG